MTDYADITAALIAGDAGKVSSLVQAELDQGTTAGESLNTGLIKGMDIVGERMQSGDMFIPEVLMAAMAMMEQTIDAIRESGKIGGHKSCKVI